jgi:hypothetical protein
VSRLRRPTLSRRSATRRKLTDTTSTRILSKPIQINPSKIAWISLVLFVRNRTSQWVTGNPNKKIRPSRQVVLQTSQARGASRRRRCHARGTRASAKTLPGQQIPACARMARRPLVLPLKARRSLILPELSPRQRVANPRRSIRRLGKRITRISDFCKQLPTTTARAPASDESVWKRQARLRADFVQAPREAAVRRLGRRSGESRQNRSLPPANDAVVAATAFWAEIASRRRRGASGRIGDGKTCGRRRKPRAKRVYRNVAGFVAHCAA